MKKQAPGVKRILVWIRPATWWMQLEWQSARTPVRSEAGAREDRGSRATSAIEGAAEIASMRDR